jgi:hypothetical protein
MQEADEVGRRELERVPSRPMQNGGGRRARLGAFSKFDRLAFALPARRVNRRSGPSPPGLSGRQVQPEMYPVCHTMTTIGCSLLSVPGNVVYPFQWTGWASGLGLRGNLRLTGLGSGSHCLTVCLPKYSVAMRGRIAAITDFVKQIGNYTRLSEYIVSPRFYPYLAQVLSLFPPSFPRRRLTLFSGGIDVEILKLLAGFKSGCKPSRPQSASCPGLTGIFGIAVFRSDSASWTAPTSSCPQSACCKPLQPAELLLNRSAFFNEFGAESSFDLLSEF